MANLHEVKWSSKAIRDFENIILYLETNWTQKEIRNFKLKLTKAITLISTRPTLFRLTNYRKNLRRCVLTKQTSIYYQNIDKTIYIVAIFDNRRSPANIPHSK